MPQSTSSQTVQYGTSLAPGKHQPLITFLKDEDGQLSGVQSSIDIDPKAFINKTFNALASLNCERPDVKEYRSRFDTIIDDCLTEEANGDWRIDVTDSVDEFQKRLDNGRGFAVLWTDNPTEKNLTKEGAKILAMPTISCLPNTETQEVDVLANRPVPPCSGVRTTLYSFAKLNKKPSHGGFLTDFSNRLGSVKDDSVNRWRIIRVHPRDAREHERRRTMPNWYAPISEDNNTVRFSKQEAEMFRGSSSIATNMQASATSINPKSGGTTLGGQQEVPEDWDEMGSGQEETPEAETMTQCGDDPDSPPSNLLHTKASLDSPTEAASNTPPQTDEYAFAQTAPHDPDEFMTDHWSSDAEV